MDLDLLIGVASLVAGAALLFIGLPDRSGTSPRFLQFEASLVLYPPLIMICFAWGIAELFSWFFRASH